MNELIQEENAVNEWLIEGNIFLIPKSDETKLPHKYQPTTCKLLTGIIAEMMHHHLTQPGGLEAK